MTLTRRRVTSAAGLKALAHPVRMALLGALVTEGPLTASQAGRMIDESAANCSWHLRKLAEQGFVREARGGTGRNRPWRAVSEGLEWVEDVPEDDQPDQATQIAAEALTDMLVEREVQRLRVARASRAGEPTDWREATGLVKSDRWLTAEEARRLKDDLTEVLTRHAERSGDPDLRPAGARLVSLVGWVVPSGPLRAARAAEDPPSA